ncbi:MAG: hypothetical protein IJE46_03815 [Clostridia bacterium]|nr:hypothetical protein [Clostridia bacterium]
MSNSNKVILYFIGLIFVIVGTATALEMINISLSSAVLLIIGIAFLVLYKKLHNKIFKYLSSFFVPTGIAYFIITSFNVPDVVNFLLIYFSLASAFLCLYFTTKRKLFLYISFAVIMFALHVFTNAQRAMSEFLIAYDCIYVAVLCVVLFVLEHKSFGYIPLYVAIVLYCGAVLNFMNSYNVISPMVYKLLLSIVFVIIGAVIIGYCFAKSKNDKEEALHE